ncbi:MAG: single-stranded DNA-binding protein [Bacillota bacterium]|jgi:single-strand DNA-binding protein|nr:single-stranded DNA-binding protein [Bacillota bacterium]NLV70554.1 single-stranded DNA-binding protein [Clostridiales bacterium]HPF19412.1 single-stranded DNA-binding protein [Bacillota bacterium]
MNSVSLIGRLTRDPDIRYGAGSQTAVARFSIAIDRGKDKNGEDRGADFPTIVCFGKTAELVERYLTKGRLVGIQGRIQTGKYEKDGRTIYTTDILADRVEFLDWGDRNEGEGGGAKQKSAQPKSESQVPEGFGALTDDDIPF